MSAKPFLNPTPGMFIQEDWFEGADSFLDLVMFIATGIIIILILENITKLIRKF